MVVADIAASVTAMQQSVQATHVQMALLKRNMEIQTQGLLNMLEAARQTGANPPHLGNLIDTSA